MSDFRTVVCKEITEIIALWRGRGKIHIVMLVAVFGVYFPWSVGPRWVTSPGTMLMFMWFPVMMATSITADAFAGERERHTLDTLLATRLSDRVILAGKLAAAVLYGLSFLWFFILSGLVTVNVVHAKDEWLFFPAPAFVGFLLLGTFGSIFAAGIGVIVSLKSTTVRQAQQTLNLAILGLVIAVAGAIAFVPASWRQWMASQIGQGKSMQIVLLAAVILTLVDAVVLYLARRMFRRPRLLA